jgi:hypothetical protein
MVSAEPPGSRRAARYADAGLEERRVMAEVGFRLGPEVKDDLPQTRIASRYGLADA